jgi:two-component system, cell cycle response regulator
MTVQKDQKKILIVEDDPSVMEVVVEAMKSEKYIVDTATSADEALDKLKLFQPHLVLTDNDMPGLTGIDMLKILRQQQNYVTVIFLSGRTDAQFVTEALKAGADDYIRKPYRINELLARVEVALRNNNLHAELMQANLKLHDLIDHDDLTGLYNMRSMYQKIDLEIKRAKRARRFLACVMLDMDKFKTVNDNHDHLFGSFVLKTMGTIIRKTMRDTDFAARYGGDEFLIVLTETEKKGVNGFCDRLRKAVEEFTFTSGVDSMKLTISLGYALGGHELELDARNLVRAADHNLYKAKESGRNRTHGD